MIRTNSLAPILTAVPFPATGQWSKLRLFGAVMIATGFTWLPTGD